MANASKSKIEKLLRTNREAYFKNPEIQALYRTLIEDEQRAQAGLPAPARTAIDDKVKEFRDYIRSDREAYFRDADVQSDFRTALTWQAEERGDPPAEGE